MIGRRPLILAAALCGCVAAGVVRADDRPATPRLSTMRVEGVATSEATPDQAVITLGVTTDRASAVEAAGQTARTAQILVDEMKASGVEERDIATTQASLTPVYEIRKDNETPKIKAYRAANLVRIRVRRLEKAGDLAGRLIDKGANAVEGVDFIVSDPQPALDRLMAEATHDARRRADIYAKAAGVKLGRVVQIEPESNAPAPYAGRLKMAAMDAAPAVPLQAGSQTMEMRVAITWELMPAD